MNVTRIHKNELPGIELPGGDIEIGQAISYSMKPFFPKGALLLIQKKIPACLEIGELVFVKTEYGLMMHRIVKRVAGQPEQFITKGDWNTFCDPPCDRTAVYGIAAGFLRKGKIISLQTPFYKILGKGIALFHPIMDLLLRIVRKTKARLTGKRYNEHPKAGD